MRRHLVAPCVWMLLTACSSSGGGAFTPEPTDAAVTKDVSLDVPAAADAATLDTPVDARRDVVIPTDVSVANLCGACTSDGACGAGARCATLSGGVRACLPECNPDVPNCPGGLRCVLDFGMVGGAVCAPVGGPCCVDSDGDGYGRGVGCMGNDCDDADRARHPMVAETCNNVDDNCDGRVDEGPLTRACHTGCGDGTETCAMGAWAMCSARTPAAREVCDNGVDDDCNGAVDDGCTTEPPPTGGCTFCSDRVDVTVMSGSTEVHVVGFYEAYCVHGASHPATVRVTRTGVPIVLVLSSYEPVNWTVVAAPGVNVARVILNGFNRHTVTGTSAPVDDFSGVGRYLVACAYRWPSDTGGCDTPGLVSRLASMGHPVTHFHGCYTGGDVLIAPPM